MKTSGQLEDILGNLVNFDVLGTVAIRVTNRWNQLDQRTVGAPSIIVFKGQLNETRETSMGFFMD